ncbi:MAG: PSD1 and planctomycete cytochrome C domain-containing protein [Planctomycetaceae bacterium]
MSLLLVNVSAFAQESVSSLLEFNRDIRPILSSQCMECHGRDDEDRQAGVRFDLRASALSPADSGEIPIVPGNPDFSELIRRVESTDPATVMPPAGSGKELSERQKTLLRRWVTEGAEYEDHWAFVPPDRPEPPSVKQSSWLRNPIDAFILARMEQAGLNPSPEAERSTLFRRLSLDLTGLPPTLEDFAAFSREMSAAEREDQENSEQPGERTSTTSSSADRVYSRWVNKLLASPHYGERMAVDWLDAARFADTNGYQVDRDREMYAWRDWVINAFNVNLPFDQFTIEQVAGDLLPDATLDQRIATGFLRNHMLNEEGGVIPEEFLAEYCADRVETTMTVWLGQTFLCARCHDHKYDPFTQRDYYSLFAFFHNAPEQGLGNYGANIRRNAPPILKLPAPELEAKIQSLNQDLAEVQKHLAETEATLASESADWSERIRHSDIAWSTVEATSARLGEAMLTLDEERSSVRLPATEAGDYNCVIEAQLPLAAVTAMKLEFSHVEGSSEPESDPGSATSNIQLTHLQVMSVGEEPVEPQPLPIRAAQIADSLPAAEVAKALDEDRKVGTIASLVGDAEVSAAVTLEVAAPAVPPGIVRFELSISVSEPTSPLSLRIYATDADQDLLLPSDIDLIVQKLPTDRTGDEVKRLSDFRKTQSQEHRRLTEQVAAINDQIDNTDLEIPTTLVMEEMSTPRATHILMRGAYNRQGDVVTAETPVALLPMSPDLPRNRLGLAKWIVDPENPLTARVAVNRLWQSLFGVGLVRTAEDFGTQGEPPSHPELLDWLATEFVRSGWDVKAMMSLLVNSSTYRQSSRQTPSLQLRDPENRLLARGARFRLQAEFLRDQALAASGLVVPQIGGPSVKPYHPPGLYEQVVAGSSANTYVVGEGTDLYRRSLYTYWKRSVPNPAMLLFDAPFRETCTMRRSRTNTPLQALNLMNDPTYVEAARCLAQRMRLERGDTPREWIGHGFRLVLVRPPNETELAILVHAYDRCVEEYRNESEGADGLVSVGDSPTNPQVEQAQLAALTTVASTILNLDETVTRE